LNGHRFGVAEFCTKQIIMYKSSVADHPLFSSFTLQQHQLKNRLAVAPMSRVSARPRGVPSSDMQAYYHAFAEGNFSMIITEGIYTDSAYSQAYPLQPGMVTSEQVNGWKQVVEKVKQEPVLFMAQLMHAGAISQSLSSTLAPSAVQPLGKKMPEYGGGEGAFPLPAAMTIDDIKTATAGFVQAALHAWHAGFDGVEIHAANGYLLDQFITDYTNQRNDEYGGCTHNRFRIIREIIQGIRTQTPASFLIGLRLSEGKVNNLKYRWPEGAAMAREVLREVTDIQPAYTHIAAESGHWQRDCLYTDGTSFTGLARSITGLPVIANGGLSDLSMAEEVLRNGHADLLAIGKAALADPHWPLHTLNGHAVRPFHPRMIRPSATIAHTREMRDVV